MSIINKIKNNITIEEYIIKKLGLKIKPVGTWLDVEHCPCCGGRDCFRIAPDRNSWYCFQHYRGGDVINLRSGVENITYKEAIIKFASELGLHKERAEDKSVEWMLIRQDAQEYLTETLFTCSTYYIMRGSKTTPLSYLMYDRKHSLDAIIHFGLGFNDGGLLEHLRTKYDDAILCASGFINANKESTIPAGCFTYPFIVKGEIKYFRVKDPNKIIKAQMPGIARSMDCYWYNQDALVEGGSIVVTEGEDDVITLFDHNIPAIGCCGTLTTNQVNYLIKFRLKTIYTAFDNDKAGNLDTSLLIRSNPSSTVLIMQLPPGQDIDDVLREGKMSIEELKANCVYPSPEQLTSIRVRNDGYYILKNTEDAIREKRISNWTINIKAVIFRGEDEKMRKCSLNTGNGYDKEVIIPSEAFSSALALRTFMLANSEQLLYFSGNDSDLIELIKFLSISSHPKIIIESDCVGEIKEGFIAENVFIDNTGGIKPLKDGFLALDENRSIHLIELVKKGAAKSEIPYFDLTIPFGGVVKLKHKVYDLLIKNRNLKMALAIGWTKAVMWSKAFYERRRFFPLLCIHGKYASGKSVAAQWLMSFVGLRDTNPEMLSDRGTTEVGLARKLSYYSSLPVFIDDYRADETGTRFHTFLRGVYDRTSPTKGLQDDFGVRRTIIRGCVILTGEHAPTDPALLSRMFTIEMTRDERTDKYYKEIIKLEPQFNIIGLDWLKKRWEQFEAFYKGFEELEEAISLEIDDPRQAGVLAVVVSSLLTENLDGYFFNKDDVIDYAIKLSKMELDERKKGEIIPNLWEAVDVLKKKGLLDEQAVHYDIMQQEVYVNLPSLMGAILGGQFTKHYKFPNHREIAKLLKQEKYIKSHKPIRVDGQLAWRWVIDIKSPHCPESLHHTFDIEREIPSDFTEPKEVEIPFNV